MTAPAAQAAAPTLLDLYLKQLCLPAMARAYPAVVREAAANRHDYLQFLITLCGYEIEHRQRNQLARRLKQAQFPWPKTLDEFDFSAVPALNKAKVLDLARGEFVRAHEPVIIVGNPGVGKTHLAIGVARACCQQGYRVRFVSAVALVNELVAAQQEYRLNKLLKQFRAVDLVVVDELGYLPFSPDRAQLLFQFFGLWYPYCAVPFSSAQTPASCGVLGMAGTRAKRQAQLPPARTRYT